MEFGCDFWRFRRAKNTWYLPLEFRTTFRNLSERLNLLSLQVSKIYARFKYRTNSITHHILVTLDLLRRLSLSLDLYFRLADVVRYRNWGSCSTKPQSVDLGNQWLEFHLGNLCFKPKKSFTISCPFPMKFLFAFIFENPLILYFHLFAGIYACLYQFWCSQISGPSRLLPVKIDQYPSTTTSII